MKKLLFFLILIISISFHSKASHIPGGNITYQCTGNANEYVITLELYVSCPNTLSASLNIIATNSCGLSNPVISLPQIGVAQEISSICPSQQSTCTGGTFPGIMSYTYQSIITLPDTCNSWTFAFELCCRNTSSNLSGAAGNSMYFQTVMNSQTSPCDDSPYATTQPSPFFCAGLPQTFCPGIVDPNGDSLYIQLVNPMGAGAAPITHLFPYGPATPLQTLAFDPVTGCFTFNQPTVGNFVVTYLIEAYDNTGNMTGSIIYDFQFQVLACSNLAPTPNPTGIIITSGNGTLLNPNLIELCEGENTCFDVTFNDLNPLDTLSIDSTLSNLLTLLPGAVLSLTGINPLTINICWTAPVGSNSSFNTTLTVNDGACPIMAFATENISFSIINSTVANQDLTICGSDPAQLSVNGGSIFTWSSLFGDPIILGTNFSCNPCANPIATPTTTTTYLVTSNIAVGCNNIDTITVNVVSDFTNVAYGDTLICDYLSVPIGVTNTPAGAYSVIWSPASSLNNPTSFTPVANPTQSTTYIASVTSPFGCVKTDTVQIDLVPPPALSISPGDTIICDSAPTLQFNIESTCDYTLEMFDSFGDGWNNQSIDIYENGILIGTYTVTTANNGGNSNTVTFPVISGSTITILYNTGAFQNESSFNLIDGTGATQFAVATGGMTGWIQGNTYFTGIANCGPTLLNGYSYFWSPGNELNDSNIINPIATPTTTTNYIFTLIDSISGCSTNRSQLITILPGFTLQTTLDDSICIGDTVNFIVSPSVSGSYSYLWTPGGLLNDSTIFNPIGTFSSVGINVFTIEVNNGVGCIITDSVTIIVSNCSVNIIEFGEDYNINIFPNPNNGTFNITKPVGLNKSIEIKLFNVLGEVIIEDRLTTKDLSTTININETSNGIYFLHLIIGEQTVVKRILKD